MRAMLKLTEQQQKAYDRFIRARDRIQLVKTKDHFTAPFIPLREWLTSVDVAGLNHQLFVTNDDYIEYKNASEAWWRVEPAFRDQERLRASRGDYGTQDSWDDPSERIKDIYEMAKEGAL